jgi:hypothetical protein
MRKTVLGLLGAAAVAFSTAAGAVTITPDQPSNPTGTYFIVAGDIFSGPIDASFGHVGIPTGSFTDLIQFTIPQTGLGSGSITTETSLFGGATDLDILSVLVNGVAATLTLFDANDVECLVRGVGTCGTSEQWTATGVPIEFGVLNTITVSGTSRGLGGYGGHATFTPAVPEPATWGMMLLGFGAVGFAMRRRRRPALMQLA